MSPVELKAPVKADSGHKIFHFMYIFKKGVVNFQAEPKANNETLQTAEKCFFSTHEFSNNAVKTIPMELLTDVGILHSAVLYFLYLPFPCTGLHKDDLSDELCRDIPSAVLENIQNSEE